MGEMNDGSKCWFPNVDIKYKPKVGDGFESVESAEKMYRKYANEVGFDVRLSNKKINKIGRITSQFYVCSKEGRPPSKYFDSLDVLPNDCRIRNSNIKCSGCGTCFKIHFVKERRQYEVYKFVEQHNHMLFNKEGMSSKVGVTKSHRFRKSLKGGVDLSGGTVRDHQNFKRDMAYFVGNKDAQMLLKHALIFVPFVAIDNHKKFFVVGAALIQNESVVDYTWISNYLQYRMSFVTEFNKLVWNVHLGLDEFEMQWNNMMDLYRLRGDPWFDELYEIRESWISAYYKDYQMSGLKKTTSRSENINVFLR
ncbi:protein FAR1-RELATED SEQUENCE 1-like [Cynara cardunculus var. scolymus]|uniref:protein FAR1-RELATED SEQUENCE 1-like n=1 Tax=Cynara cardunculus var. scolymus TaxID=59895 RepID=UPI000D628497|nr:protein FAR1-RELATED SEQUENCE 1-like [Cynara cardunculus var. scolymus]